ncbi:MAG: metal ABC transporter ATP-binding protein [Actinomycetia bacterium]|nr:metal ABC transporter ATP-binding protein [Actinomycetes bacterium]
MTQESGGPPTVAARDLVLSYDRHIALDSSSFSIPGQVGTIAIIGPNGSGKSTLLHAMTGLIRPREGALQVLGKDPVAIRSVVSYVQQTTQLHESLPITVRQVVAMGRYPKVGWWRRLSAHDRALIQRAMDRMQVADLASRQFAELSGGQRQRVLIAQGIAQEHQLLLLDEPLTGLDLTSARTIDALVHGEREDGCTVVLTTHDLDEARAADQVILVGGKVLAAGPPDQVLTRRNLETAFGLGALHGWKGFLDSPHHD